LDGAQGVATGFYYKLQLAKQMSNAMKLKWLDFNLKKDMDTMNKLRPRIIFTDEFLGQVCAVTPTLNQKNKFTDYHQYKNYLGYHKLFMKLMAQLFPAMFKMQTIRMGDLVFKGYVQDDSFNIAQNIRKLY
jgi:hypothetical protein